MNKKFKKKVFLIQGKQIDEIKMMSMLPKPQLFVNVHISEAWMRSRENYWTLKERQQKWLWASILLPGQVENANADVKTEVESIYHHVMGKFHHPYICLTFSSAKSWTFDTLP